MTAAWVAASARGRLLTRRRLGAGGARAVADAGSTEAAVAVLARSPYRRGVDPTMSGDAAGRAVGAVCLWHLRVLAGWLPPRADDVVRVFAGYFEVANVVDRLAALDGGAVPEPYALGALATAWPRVAAAATKEDVRAALARSPWGDPGTTDQPAVAVAMEARWASWLAEAVPDTPAWAAGRAAVVAVGAVDAGRAIPPAARADLRRLLGDWERAGLPSPAAWAVDRLDGPDLWRAEGRWWTRVDRDAAATLRRGRPGPAIVAAASARLVADAWRARSALEAAGWGRLGLETFDAVA